MDERHYYDPRHRPPPTTPGRRSGGESPPLVTHREPGYYSHRAGDSSPPPPPPRDPAYHRPKASNRGWEDEQAPPPLPMLSGSSGVRDSHPAPAASSSHHIRPLPPHHYEYGNPRPTYEEERAREYGRSYAEDYPDHRERYHASPRNVSAQSAAMHAPIVCLLTGPLPCPSVPLLRLLVLVLADPGTAVLPERVLQPRHGAGKGT